MNAFDSIVVVPAQMADSPIIPDGTAFTVMVTVAEVGTPTTVADTVYVVVTVGETVIVAQVVQESPVAGAHE